jgi:hypothetical protein
MLLLTTYLPLILLLGTLGGFACLLVISRAQMKRRRYVPYGDDVR